MVPAWTEQAGCMMRHDHDHGHDILVAADEYALCFPAYL